MDNPYSSPSSNPGGPESFGSSGRISPRASNIMARTKGWVRFLAVLLFIGFGLSVINMLISQGSPAKAGGDAERIGQIAGIVVTLLFYLYPAVKLNSYASRIGVLLQSGRPGDLEAALNEHRALWRYLGIVVIVVICIVVLGMVFGVASAFSR